MADVTEAAASAMLERVAGRTVPTAKASPREVIERAAAALATRGQPLAGAEWSVPALPGLYAIHAESDVWEELGLAPSSGNRPLYVGKAETSLVARDVRTHFGDGRTGQSTVRRSFAALLCDRLELTAIPRNPARPERFANYGLGPQDDCKLTRWMRERLRLALWEQSGGLSLVDLERVLLARWSPPLNLRGVPARSQRLLAARARMAADARDWARERGFPVDG